MLPTSTLLLTSTTTLASPSSQVAADVTSVMDGSLFGSANWMSMIDLSSLGWLFFYFLAFLSVVSCLKFLWNHRQSIAAFPGLLRQFFTDVAGNRVRNIGIHVVGDVNFLVDETAGAMARMNRRSRRAMQASIDTTRRAADRAGRYVSDNTRIARIRTVQVIHDPFFGGIIGVTVVYLVNFGVPVIGRGSCKCGMPTDMANVSHDAQNLEHIRRSWSVMPSPCCQTLHANQFPRLQLFQLILSAVLDSLKTHWILTSIFSVCVGIPCAIVGIVIWHDNLPQEQRVEVNRHVNDVRIWFLTIDWPKHREKLVGLCIRCYTGFSNTLAKIGDGWAWSSSIRSWIWCAMTKLCSWTWRPTVKVTKVVGNLLWKLFRGLFDFVESGKLAKAQKHFEDYRQSQKTAMETMENVHKTKVEGLQAELDSGELTIGKLEQEIGGLASDLQLERYWRSKDAISWNSQLDQAQSVNSDAYQTGWPQAKRLGKECKDLKKTNLEQQQQHKSTLDKVQKELTEAKSSLDNHKQHACEQHTQTITGLQQTEQGLITKLKGMEDELNNFKNEARCEVENVKEEAARKIQSDTAELRRELNDEREQKRNLQRMYDGKVSDHSDLTKLHEDFKTQHNTCSSDYQLLKKQREELKTQHDTCSSDNQSLKKQLEDLKSKQGATPSKDDGLKAELATANKQLFDVKAENEILKKDAMSKQDAANKELLGVKAENEKLKKDAMSKQGAAQPKDDGEKAELEATKKELLALKAENVKLRTDAQTIQQHNATQANAISYSAFRARFPNQAFIQNPAPQNRNTMGLEALCYSLQQQSVSNVSVAELQAICDDPLFRERLQQAREEPDNGFIHDHAQLTAILKEWSERQKIPLALGTSSRGGDLKGSRFHIKFMGKVGGCSVVWIHKQLYDKPKEGEQPNASIMGEWCGIRPLVPEPEKKEGGSEGVGFSNNKPTGNGNQPNGKDASDNSESKGGKGPEDVKPSGTNASSNGKEPDTSKGNTNPDPSNGAEEDFKSRFPNSFKLLSGDVAGEINGFNAVIKSMSAMNLEAPYKSLPVPTYAQLDQIADSAEGPQTLPRYYGGDFDADNLDEEGLNWVLRTWGWQRGLNLQLGSVTRKDGEHHQPEGWGNRDDVVDLVIQSNPRMGKADFITVWIYNDAGGASQEDRDVGFFSDWHGMKPK
ncbi:MAG: hypothetical protein Q9205_003961 [Flavoplaca limonia]